MMNYQDYKSKTSRIRVFVYHHIDYLKEDIDGTDDDVMVIRIEENITQTIISVGNSSMKTTQYQLLYKGLVAITHLICLSDHTRNLM